MLSGCGQRWSDGPPAGWRSHVYERAEERTRQGLPLLCHQGKNQHDVTFIVTSLGR